MTTVLKDIKRTLSDNSSSVNVLYKEITYSIGIINKVSDRSTRVMEMASYLRQATVQLQDVHDRIDNLAQTISTLDYTPKDDIDSIQTQITKQLAIIATIQGILKTEKRTCADELKSLEVGLTTTLSVVKQHILDLNT